MCWCTGARFFKQVEFLVEKPNVYSDFSAQTFLFTPAALSPVLRDLLEYKPEKVLFGTGRLAGHARGKLGRIGLDDQQNRPRSVSHRSYRNDE